jgi:hypothetical protein
MSSFDSLPGDQRAVLQLVLERGRNYDEIASLLSIDRAAVRDRALAALNTLGPSTRVPPERRALIIDYLLGQLPDQLNDQTRERLASSAVERAWARLLARELAPIASKPLPDIPPSQASTETAIARETATSTATPAGAHRPPEGLLGPPGLQAPEDPGLPDPHAAEDSGLSEPEAPEDPGTPARRPPEGLLGLPGPKRPKDGRSARPQPPEPPQPPERPDDRRPAPAAGRSSRRGGSIVLVFGALIVVVVVVVIVVIAGGGSSPKKSSPKHATTTATTPATTTATTPATTTATTPATTTATTPATTTATTTSTTPQLVAQIALRPPSATSEAAGIAEIVTEGKVTGVIVEADHVPPNTAHNAYAVWLDTPGGAAKLLGYVSPGVGTSGELKTTSDLPTNAVSYKELLITLETTANTTAPGPIVLEGALSLTAG